MTRDEIIRMAWEAGFQVLLPRDHVDGTGGVYVEDDDIAEMLERVAALVAAAEREACREIAFRMAHSDEDAVDVSHAIRARGET